MKCSKCNENTLRCLNNAYKNNLMVRTRECISCGHRVKTVEIPYEVYEGLTAYIKVIKRLSKVL